MSVLCGENSWPGWEWKSAAKYKSKIILNFTVFNLIVASISKYIEQTIFIKYNKKIY